MRVELGAEGRGHRKMVQAEPKAGTQGRVVGAWLGRAAGTEHGS